MMLWTKQILFDLFVKKVFFGGTLKLKILMFNEKYLNKILEANKPQAEASKTVLRSLSLPPSLKEM